LSSAANVGVLTGRLVELFRNGRHPLNLFLNFDEALRAFGTNLEFAASD
jgi:hypothetical protein